MSKRGGSCRRGTTREEAKESRHQMEEAFKAHEELQKVNEELRQALRNQTAKTTPGALRPKQVLNDPQAFTQTIMVERVPPHNMVPKMVPFSGASDFECCLKVFMAQMLILGGSNAVGCKFLLRNHITMVQWDS